MTRTLRLHCLALASLAALGLTACGGGGSSGDTPAAAAPAPVATPAAVTLSGTAATGAPFSGASLTVTDKRGQTVGSVAAIGADGSYSVTLDAGAQAPFVLTARRDGEQLVSVHDSARSGTVNVTPVTTLLAARLSPSGDPARLADEVASGAATVDTAALAARLEEIRTLLQPLLQATGTQGDDLLRGRFRTDGQGQDRLLDSLKITITPDSDRSTNIQITIRQHTDDGREPASVGFNSATAATVPTLPAVAAASLVGDGTSTLVADLMTRLTACYALPLTERVDSTAATAGPANVIAAACRSLFVDGEPAGYLHSGARVGAAGAFGGLYRASAVGVSFGRGTYEFGRANGDLVVSYTTTNPNTGNSTDTGTVVARRVTSAAGRAELRLIGNQYAYDGGVAAYHQRRRFLTLDQSAYDYHSVGYTLNVANTTDGAGRPLFDHVVVTSPKGNTLTLKPTAGSSYLVLVKNGGTLTGTNFVRLRSRFIDAQTGGHPSQRDPGLFFVQNDLDDEGVSDLSAQSSWQFDYYLASDPTRLAATQHYKTRARPLTLNELRQRGLATLADADVSAIRAAADASTGRVPLPASGGVTLNWRVAGDAPAPTQIQLWGRLASGGAFNDRETVLASARTGAITCSRQTSADAHCDAASARHYATGTTADGLHLWSRDSDGREFASFYALYKVAQPN